MRPNVFLSLTFALLLGIVHIDLAAANEHGEESEPRDAYEQRMSRQIEQYRAASSGRSFSEDLERAWGAVQRDWRNLIEATEENWDEAQEDLDEAWSSFEQNWTKEETKVK